MKFWIIELHASISFMKKMIVIIITLVYSICLFSQDTLSENIGSRRHAIQISCLDLLINNISVSYSYFFSKKHSIELMLGYRFKVKSMDNKIAFIEFEDPFWLYNQISTRLGISNYIIECFYITPMIICNYSYFDNRYWESYIDREGDAYDVDYELGRSKTSIGGLVKFGLTPGFKKIKIDGYLGLGCRAVFINEKIYKKVSYYNEIIPDDYPVKSNKLKYLPTIHLGLLFGLRF